MKRNIEIIAYHGWGMSAHFWEQWDDLFPEHVTFKKNDRGYFSEPSVQHFHDDEAIRILFVQGFGMHWVSQSDWANAHVIVLFSAFNNLKEVMSKNRKLDYVIHTLQDEIKKSPNYTLDLLWETMFKSGEQVADTERFRIRDHQLLINDLETYYHNLVQSVPIKEKAKVLLYETEFDDLAVFSQVRQMKQLFGRLSYYKQFDFVGHGFPFNRAEACFKDMAEHLKIFD